MTKPRDILKGKVKRLLRDQEDMGQLCDPAVEHCVSALEAFVHDLGKRLHAQAATASVPVITPIELKRVVLASSDLPFLHEKVAAIDESDAKYHKGTRKRKAAAATNADAAQPKSTKTKKKSAVATSLTKAKRASKANVEDEEPTAAEPAVKAAAAATAAPAIEEDDDYDSSDSE